MKKARRQARQRGVTRRQFVGGAVAAAAPPDGTTDLSTFPRYFLLANESTAQWHEFGMEWKEHVAFLAPIAATVVAFVVSYYGPQLARKVGERRAVMIFFIVAFVATAVAGMFGAFITKAAAVR